MAALLLLRLVDGTNVVVVKLKVLALMYLFVERMVIMDKSLCLISYFTTATAHVFFFFLIFGCYTAFEACSESWEG